VSGASGGPLAGFRVVDFTENMAGPFGTMILADQGADVIKVESPEGDALRTRGTGTRELSTYFANLNRSKRSLCLDLRHPRSAEVLGPLLDSADVVVHSFRPAAAQRLRIDADTVRASRPRLVHASIIGFGTEGPWAGRPVYDHVIQATSGMADAARQNDDDPPRLTRHGLVDKTTGHVMAQSVTAALLQRSRTGQGVSLNVVMLDVAIALLWPDGMVDQTALEPEVLGPAPALTYQLTPTADGYLSLVVLKPQSWQNLINALDLRPHLAEGPRMGDILRAAKAVLKTMSTTEAAAQLSDYDVPCAPVVAMADVPLHPQVIANQTLVNYQHPVMGQMRQPRPVPAFPGVDADTLVGARRLGEDPVAVLGELGLDEPAIRTLLADKVVSERAAVGISDGGQEHGHDNPRPSVDGSPAAQASTKPS
jgi:crotonobetainyl-CoA:carnitine CoA-transferase CaiB-like acyl-CoA transferase